MKYYMHRNFNMYLSQLISRSILSKYFSVFFLFFFLCFPLSNVKAAVLEVCPLCNFSSIHRAVEQAQAGDVIEVQKGEYAEPALRIEKPLTLKGLNRPVIDGQHLGNVILIVADQVKVEGFIIRNSGQSLLQEFAGIRAEKVKNCELRNNFFENNNYSIYLAKVDTCKIENNIAEGNAKGEVTGGNGLHAWYSLYLQISNNQFKKHRDGIYLEFTTDSNIEKNLSTKNIRYGLHFMYSHRNRYFGNSFIDNQTGVAVMYSRQIEMRENTFEKSWGRSSYGLLLKDISDSVVDSNFIKGNTIGLFADEISRDQFQYNTFQDNGWAIQILGSSSQNSFVGNNFLNNYFNVATNGHENENQFEGNYWNDYQGYDLDRDGAGDVPFRPMKIFSLWVSQYPELVILLGSPVISFLEVAEKIFPVLTPKTLQDNHPSMKLLGATKG